MATQQPPERPKRLFPRQCFTSKVGKDWTVRTPLDKWLPRANERIPVKGTINGEPFNAKIDFKTHPDAWWDAEIPPEGYYEISLNSPARYQLRRLPVRVGMKVDVEMEYDFDQYAKDDIFKAKNNARAARKREQKRKAEAAAKKRKT